MSKGISEKSDRPSISADFEVIRVQTMANNAVRVVLEMPEHMIPQMGMFAECKRRGIYLHGEFTAKALTEIDDETIKGAETQVIRMDRRRIGKR
jgi:hypothetical protein